MKTRWGKALDPNNVLQEYPRPQMVRESYLNLNGLWDYAITEDPGEPEQFQGQILVPFSPESELSGVNRTLLPGQTLWYRREISLPLGFDSQHLLLHFGAVDQIARVALNGVVLGTHVGGFTPFTFDLSDVWRKDERNLLTVTVLDTTDASWHSRGKQKLKRGGIWYSPQSGIWQTVWLESVPEVHIQELRVTPDFDASAVHLMVVAVEPAPCVVEVDGRKISGFANEEMTIPMPDFLPWTPDHPHLYPFTVTMQADRVTSYFGMRKFSIVPDAAGIKRLCLNNKPLFHSGLLDQGYYSDGMLTAPSDEALIHDIQLAKKMGFNVLRKHIKIEPLRWYYHCDRLGMLVWQDMPNGGTTYSDLLITAPAFLPLKRDDSRYASFSRADEDGRAQYYEELEEMIHTLYNAVSIAMWVPFNEGWGQFDAEKALNFIQRLDRTRTIDPASGWYDQSIGDFKSQHIYFRAYRFKPDKLGRAVILSEFGGYNCRIEGHSFNQQDFGYKKVADPEQLERAFQSLYEDQILPAKAKGLAAAIYTQLSDVEDELNGMVTYDREVVKLPLRFVKALNWKLLF